MRAAVYTGARTISVQEREIEPPGPGQVQIDVAYTGICGTDLHIFHGDMDARVGDQAVIGHEMSGRIAAVGAQVDGWQTGLPVTVMPLAWCGACPACRAIASCFVNDSPSCIRRLRVRIAHSGAVRIRFLVCAYSGPGSTGMPSPVPMSCSMKSLNG